MAEYVTVKLTTGVDIVGVLEYDTDDAIAINNPVQIEVSPEQGMFAKSYLMFSEENTVVFYRSEVLHLAPANKKASDYYDEFVKRLHEHESESEIVDEDRLSEIEDMFSSMLESKASTKH
jgi:hypothetical protein